MKIVNGYVCDCQDEVRLAKRGIDPANPHNDPVKQKELDAKHGVADPKSVDEGRPGDFDPNRRIDDGPAVLFGGTLSGQKRDGAGKRAFALLDRRV